jgi:hypothetical protein
MILQPSSEKNSKTKEKPTKWKQNEAHVEDLVEICP